MSIRDDIDAADKNVGHKISKQKAGYKAGLPQAHCGICAHFEKPDACKIVAGRIDPQKWCKYFERKKKA
jgi:hypothetical protein